MAPSRNRITVGVADAPQTAAAGRQAVERALADAPGRPPDCALLFSTSRHDPGELLAAVRRALPERVPVYGGYAVGIISGDYLGYDGFQVGVALFWLDGAELQVLVERGLNQGEAAAGGRLLQQLQKQRFRGDPSLLLLYDSVNRTGNRYRLNMATSILDGGLDRIAGEVPFVGAGLVGDMQCRTTHQWTGDTVETQTALMLAFSGGLEIEQVVFHGCRPASAYHQVTRTDENVVLEIDGRPALEVVAELLGPESGRAWRDYAFFVTLGVNKGSKYGTFDPDAYANRMCMGVDAERQGLVMFEPDLKAGDTFQLMLRDIDFSYIGEKIRAHLGRKAPSKPVFALYIDCAGRASAYSHLEEEEATYVQAALRDVCPLLGFYSGVEVARIAGRPEALDWTGVLSLFYERDAPADPAPLRLKVEDGAAGAGALAQEPTRNELAAALDYYRRHLDAAAGEQVRFDAQMSAIGRRLRQKEEGFRVLADLKRTINVRRKRRQIYQEALGMVLASMAIDRAAVIESDDSGELWVVASAGYTEEETARLRETPMALPEEIATAGFLIGNKRDKSEVLAALRASLQLPFLMAVPIARPQRRAALVVGREREMKPFYPPFDQGDVANFQAIASFLSAVVDNVQLYADTEKMAASFRRFVPEAFLKIINRSDFKSIELGDQVARRMAVLVTDIRSFTTLSERMTPEQVFSFVNEFLAEVGPVVRAHSGFVNKYIGDAVMALFNGSDDGLTAAVALIRQIGLFNERRRTGGKFPIQIGVAVNSGDLMLGTIGEAERLEGSVLADAVNLCFRLESLTKTYGAQILTTDATLSELPAGTTFNVRPVDLVTVKGKRNHVTIMEVLDGHSEDRLARKLATRDLYQSAFQSFEFGVYDEAAQLFREVAKQDPEDRAARAMMLKARKLAEGEAYTDD
jgi:class 3 adenylate cyclase